MKNYEKIYDFLETNGFKLIKKDVSEYFNDYYDVFTNDNFQIRFSSSKSFETIDIRINQSNEVWYDLILVKALLYNESNLNYVINIEEQKEFLQTELKNIRDLFNNKNYSTIKRRIEELGNERVKQMFPQTRK